MMPASTHPPSITLPAIKEAEVPFSSLFDTSFDLATVEATAQLADKSVFVTSTGRRFLFESIPDRGAQEPAQVYALAPQVPAPNLLPNANFQYQQNLHAADRRWPASNVPVNHVPAAQPGTNYGRLPVSHEPKVPTQDVTAMMGHLNINRFGAMPLYGESDGGVQAAETLTEPYTGPRPVATPMAPTMTPVQPVSAPYAPQAYQDPNAQGPVFSSRITHFDYGNFMAQAQGARYSVSSTGTLPSLMEYSSPTDSTGRRESLMLSPITPVSPYDEFKPPQASYIPQVPHVHLNGSSPPAMEVPALTPPQVYSNKSFATDANYHIDTQTPVVVSPAPPLFPQPTSSDGGSMNRDNVLPGEDMLFDGPVKSSKTITSPNFMDGQLKVFRNTISNDLRFHCRVGYESETYWMKGSNAELVPVYAYDPRFPNVLYIRDTENDKNNNNSHVQQGIAGSGRPSGIYQFPKLAELCDFQAKLTGEKVVLDIASVRLVRLSRMNSRSSDTYSSVRVQIWHEAEARRQGAQSDVASFVTAGTALSGPLRERLVPQSSRLIVFLGRLNEYITSFITDDIEVKPDGPTMVRLKVRKAGAFSKRGSRWPGIKARLVPKQGNEPAALDIRGQTTNPDIEASYDLYKTFDIDFENSPSQDNFLRKWDEVVRERRVQRRKLDQIQEEMEQVTFSGRKAREIW